jgi:hypothetical protein
MWSQDFLVHFLPPPLKKLIITHIKAPLSHLPEIGPGAQCTACHLLAATTGGLGSIPESECAVLASVLLPRLKRSTMAVVVLTDILQISGWRPPLLEQSDLFAASVRLYPKGIRHTSIG